MPELFFQPFDLNRQRRLRDIQLFGGACEVTGVGNGTKIAQMIVIEWSHSFVLSERFSLNNVFLLENPTR